MDLVINGQERAFPELPAESSLGDLLTSLGLKSDRVAVERNGSIVSRKQWPEVVLVSGDRLEIVHFVGGGATSSALGSGTPHAYCSEGIAPPGMCN